ncbi:MAG: GNAT family N-acetyltransferase [Candidatus Latescibacteria bacterium]|nr:GNAT family N-acetyltransferase [bacterium]MBD3423203.1 GNAT family N-acetyltransferase [Candidatus Latescibacterota bacterium]
MLPGPAGYWMKLSDREGEMDILREIIIRDFRIKEYQSLIDMWSASGLPFKPLGRDSRKKLESELSAEQARLLVAELEGKLAGSVLVTHDGRKGWINRLAVFPPLRRKGIAGRLIAEAQKVLEQAGIEITAALIEGENPESRNLFRKMGFREHRDIVYFSSRKHPDV